MCLAFASVALALVLPLVCLSQTVAVTTIEEQEEQIRGLTTYGSDPNEEQKLVDYIKIHSDEPNLPKALYEVSNEFWFMGNYKISRELYQHIIDFLPQSEYYIPARMWKIGCDFHLENEKQAFELLDTFITDFNNNPQLGQWLYDIGNSCWSRAKYDDAKKVYEEIIVHCPKSSQYFLARVWSIGADYWLNQYDEAHKGMERLTSDYSDKALLQKTFQELGDSLYYKYDYIESKNLYTRAMSYGEISTEYEIAKFNSSKCDQKLGVEQIENIEKKSRALFSEFGADSNVSIAVSRIADDFRESGEYDLAKQYYQIVTQNTNSPDAAIELAILNIGALVNAGDVNAAETLVNKFISDFRNNPRLTESVYRIGEKYYDRAFALEKEGQNEQAKEYYRRVLSVWEKIITQLPSSAVYTPQQAYYAMADCFYRIGNYNAAINHYKKVIVDYPGFKNNYISMFMLADCYDKLASSGEIPKTEAKEKMCDVYQELLIRFPDCKLAGQVHRQLQNKCEK
jgi:tetratricopeptide (TPR) repeat protein